MQIERISLFNTKREWLTFFLACSLILLYSLLIHYNDYKRLTRFSTYETTAKIIAQYDKTDATRKSRIYKLLTREGLKFYTFKASSYKDLNAKKVRLTFWTSKITFYGYLTDFYAYTHIHEILQEESLKHSLNSLIDTLHEDDTIGSIYKALYTATPMPSELQNTLSILGISHLLAISGFHLGVLSGVLFFLFRPLYRYFQNRYFPFSHANRDLFIFVACSLLVYMLFLDTPPSLLRAFGMLIVGFVLFDRGYEIISMQTLLLSISLLLSLFPSLFFSLGFWLSSAGVFYIFLFFIRFKFKSRLWQSLRLPFWIYLMMLPYSLFIFENFSVYHPLSILWSVLFSLFYPLSIVLHLLGFGNIFDTMLLWVFSLADNSSTLSLSPWLFLMHLLFSLASVFYQRFSIVLLFIPVFTLFYALVFTA